jgi:hypothetical protein
MDSDANYVLHTDLGDFRSVDVYGYYGVFLAFSETSLGVVPE